MKMTKKYAYHLAVMASTMILGAMPQAIAAQKTLQEADIAQAHVSTVTITKTNGSLTIANGRNCLVDNGSGTLVLKPCPNTLPVDSTSTTFALIEVTQGQCLTDEGKGPELNTCDMTDARQQWKALPITSTEVRNMATNTCLTAADLGNPVKFDKCAGLPSQAWTLPH